MENRLILWDKVNNISEGLRNQSEGLLFPILFTTGILALVLSFFQKDTDNQLYGGLGLVSLLLANSLLQKEQD